MRSAFRQGVEGPLGEVAFAEDEGGGVGSGFQGAEALGGEGADGGRLAGVLGGTTSRGAS